MFKSKTSILLAVGVLIAIAIGLQFINDTETNVADSLKLVPEDAALVIETKNFASLIQNINKNNQFKLEFEEFELWKDFFSKTELLDSLIDANEVAGLLQGTRLLISGHISANNQIEFLYILPVKKEKNQELIKQIITSQASDNEAIRKRVYENQVLYDFVSLNEDIESIKCTFAFIDDIFVFSFSKILAEAAVLRLNSGFSLAADRGFIELAETSGKNADVNIYVNYKFLPVSFSRIIDNSFKGTNEFLKGFAAWTEFDAVYKDDAFLMSGFTFSNDSLSHYINIFKGQSAVNNDFLETLPGNTAAFIAFNFSDANLWRNKYTEYLQKRGEFNKQSRYFEIAAQKYKRDLRDLFYNNIEGGVCICWANNNPDVVRQYVYGIIQVKDGEMMATELENIKPVDSLDRLNYIPPQSIGNSTAHYFSEDPLFGHLFGDAFLPLKAKFYTVIEDQIVFAESIEALNMYAKKSITGTRLTDDKDFLKFSNSLSSESNIYAYINFAASKSMISEMLEKDYKKNYLDNAEKFNKIQAMSIQYGLSGTKLFTNFYMNFNPQFRRKDKTVWEVQLDTGFTMKPQIVRNHNTNNNEIILQDNSNRLILISETGKVLWKKNIRGPILGTINQIDKFKNNKLQYLFNTRDEIYLVDRNGKDVEGFPIRFKSPATNGMAVFDYDNNRDYRLLVACANKSVYLLTADGGKVDGWAFGQTKGIVRLPAQHFVYDKKDYIIFADESNTYIVNRRGETRIEPKAGFEKSMHTPFFFEKGLGKNEGTFLTTDKNGDVYFIFLDGVVKKMSFNEFTENHRFEYTDIYGDGVNYFLFTDKNILQVYNRDKSLRYEIKFDAELKNSLNLYQFDKGMKYIGVSPIGLNRIFLIHPDGKVIKGFPLHGNGPFSISKLDVSDGSSDLNLITGNTDNLLFNYRLPTK